MFLARMSIVQRCSPRVKNFEKLPKKLRKQLPGMRMARMGREIYASEWRMPSFSPALAPKAWRFVKVRFWIVPAWRSWMMTIGGCTCMSCFLAWRLCKICCCCVRRLGRCLSGVRLPALQRRWKSSESGRPDVVLALSLWMTSFMRDSCFPRWFLASVWSAFQTWFAVARTLTEPDFPWISMLLSYVSLWVLQGFIYFVHSWPCCGNTNNIEFRELGLKCLYGFEKFVHLRYVRSSWRDLRSPGLQL